MEPIELMVKKVGNEYCLFTKDGSRKLGCHPTEKEAYAQEAAIQHHMEGAAALVDPALKDAERAEALARAAVVLATAVDREVSALSFHRVALGEIDVADGSYQTLENGDVVKEFALADIGEEFVNGPQRFDITQPLVDQGIANFIADGANPLPIYVGHKHDSSSPAAGWINDVFRGSDGRPWGKVQFLADTWAAIKKGLYKYFSLEFYQEGLDRKGNDVGFRFDGGAVLNNPFFPIRVDQGQRRGAGACFALSRFSTDSAAASSRDKEGTMTEKEKADAAEAERKRLELEQKARGTGDSVSLSKAQFESLLADRSEGARLKVELENERAKTQTNEARISTLERSGRAARIRAAVRRLQGDGVIVPMGDFAMDSSDVDCEAMLATQPFGITTVEGLEKLARDQESSAHLPRIPLSKERGGGTEQSIPVDLTTEAGRNEAVKRGAAQLRRTTPKHELEPMLARRHQSVEDFVRQELAADHPEYSKQILERK